MNYADIIVMQTLLIWRCFSPYLYLPLSLSYPFFGIGFFFYLNLKLFDFSLLQFQALILLASAPNLQNKFSNRGAYKTEESRNGL